MLSYYSSSDHPLRNLLACLIGSIIVGTVCLLAGCERCDRPAGVNIDAHLFAKVRIDGLSYCRAVEAAIEGDSARLRALCLYSEGDGAMFYQHGLVVIRVINRMGELECMDALGHLTPQECYVLQTTLIGGLHLADSSDLRPDCRGYDVGCTYPKLNSYLEAGIQRL